MIINTMIDSDAFLKIVKSRRSIKKLKPDPISRDLIEEMIDVAISAPSAHNAQPWRFIVITDQDLKDRLVKAMLRSWRDDLSKNEVSDMEIERLIVSSKKRTLNASILILACLTMEDMDKYMDGRRNFEYIMAVQSVSAAIQNLLLAIHVKGLGGCWRCAPLFCTEVVREVLDIPESYYPQAIIEVGYPVEKVKMPPRKPLKDIVRYNGWGRD
ncbi:MAG: nitroreductase family protein [Candidatus Methylarchaceae archaeon HK01B]|nr:nitroreductase family protein [Candidatus Methylarchaceae archaeon HK01B]